MAVLPFDPYHVWLGIPPAEQPPTHYRLLGLQLYESDPTVIDHAFDRQMSHVKSVQNGPHGAVAQQLLNKISAARICLLDSAAKAAYDLQIRGQRCQTPSPSTTIETPHVRPTGSNSSTRDRRGGRVFWEATKVILGGAAGLAVAVLVLYFAVGIDLFGIFIRTPLVAEKPLPLQPSSAKPSVEAKSSNLPTTSGNILDASLPSNSADALKKPPEKQLLPPDNPATIPPTDTAPGVPPSEPPAPSNNLATEVQPAPALPEKLNVPSPEEQRIVRATIDDIYQTEKAKDSASRQKLAQELARIAADAGTKPVEKFVLFRRSAELAVDGGDLKGSLAFVDKLAEEFDFDVLVAKQAMLSRFAKGANSDSAIGSLENEVRVFIKSAVSTDRYELALQTSEELHAACQKPSGAKYLKAAANTRQGLQQLVEEWKQYTAATKMLEATPDDQGANLLAGRWLCIRKGEWAAGLPRLAKSSDSALAAAAKADISAPQESKVLASVGDQWYDLAKRGPADAYLLARAEHWYRHALKGETGLTKARIEKRLAELNHLTKQSAAVEMEPGKSAKIGTTKNSGLFGSTNWVGLSVPIKGASFQRTISTAMLKITKAEGDSFQGVFEWNAFSDVGASTKGSYEVAGKIEKTAVEWKGRTAASGHVKNGVMCVTSDETSEASEIWLIPEKDAVRPALVSGDYRITEGGVHAFDLTLLSDGSAKKSHVPRAAGRWLGNGQVILIVWTDGWRDLLVRKSGKFQKIAFPPATSPPASSLTGEGVNPGVATKIK